ncbi:uncharacterized protein BKA78DRAFT_44991 [Phyllosticta capitalensis]|uniref:uncharacterized protein n=1 Tax=Phyllosticta capitalensis TaxID=121624 RepID=UPI00312F2572
MLPVYVPFDMKTFYCSTAASTVLLSLGQAPVCATTFATRPRMLLTVRHVDRYRPSPTSPAKTARFRYAYLRDNLDERETFRSSSIRMANSRQRGSGARSRRKEWCVDATTKSSHFSSPRQNQTRCNCQIHRPLIVTRLKKDWKKQDSPKAVSKHKLNRSRRYTYSRYTVQHASEHADKHKSEQACNPSGPAS